MIFKISVGFLAGALALLATALYLSEHYLHEETRLAATGDLRGAFSKPCSESTEAAKMSTNPSTICGVVVDARGNPVEEARVYFVEGPVPLPDIAALTDSSGRFALSAPVPGTYLIGVASEGPAGLVQKTTTVEVREEQDIDLEVRLNT